jgi:NADH dehydrogenase (ubiquinone) 1 beta subcomplex subunit 7
LPTNKKNKSRMDKKKIKLNEFYSQDFKDFEEFKEKYKEYSSQGEKMTEEEMLEKLKVDLPEEYEKIITNRFKKKLGTKKHEKMVHKVSEEEMDKADIPVHNRDLCVHHLIPLNNCRLNNYFLPFRCGEERLRYERCLFKLWLKYVRKSERLFRREEKLKLLHEEIEKKKKQEL